MAILSVQSHVSYGFVGNRAATYPLQNMGYDVWAVNTVQFSNHTGYGAWRGSVFTAEHIQDVIHGIKDLGVSSQCEALLSGYLGDKLIGETILAALQDFRQANPQLIYLCDPVMGDVGRGFFVREGILEFFRDRALQMAHIITPNHFEAQALWGSSIETLEDAQRCAKDFHTLGVKIVVITSFMPKGIVEDELYVYLSTPQQQWLAKTPNLKFVRPPNGTGDIFSALFLGNYLRSHDPAQALLNTLYAVYQVIESTWKNNQRELAILGYRYGAPKPLAEITLQKIEELELV